MTYLADPDVTLYHGDAATILATLPARSAQTCITSPPYWGLRDYGTAAWVGGDPSCGHVKRMARGDAGRPATMVPRGKGGAMIASGTSEPVPAAIQYADECGRCGATRADQQLGLEATPEAYTTALVAIFNQVHRVLRDDGTLWLNLGDSYAASVSAGAAQSDSTTMTGGRKAFDIPARALGGLKPKDLVGIPWRIAFALQAAGWYLRSDIIWSKPNPMPESVTDRPTKAHEYLFLLAKRERYYYDADAIREAIKDASAERYAAGYNGSWKRARQGAVADERETGFRGDPAPAGRNARSVWEISTQPTPEAHFATYPEALVRRCILAGSRPGDTVLDPFIGSGTTARVARAHQRHAIGIDLNPTYLDIAARRLSQQSLFTEGDR